MKVSEKRIAEIVDGVVGFVAYVESFYGKGGIYDMGCTPEHIMSASKGYIYKNFDSFCGDSLDRERVRDILIAKYGYKFPD